MQLLTAWTKEPLIKSAMNRVADENGVLAATRYCTAADCGSEGGQAIPHQVLRTAVSGLQPRKAEFEAMWDLIRGSLIQILEESGCGQHD
jgi:hypothetical protein